MKSFVPLFFIYIALGFRFYSNYAIRFMGFSPQMSQYLSSLIKVTWTIKIVFGYLIDRFNHNYRNWLILSSIIGVIGYFICLFINEKEYSIGGLVLVNLSMTLSDIVVDACMMILYRKTNESPNDIQPLAWISLYFGSFLGYLIGGFYHDEPYFYLIWCAAPLLTLICAFYLPSFTSKAHFYSFKYNNVIFNRPTLYILSFILISRSAPSYSIGLDQYRTSRGISIGKLSWSKAVGAIVAMFSSYMYKITLSKTSTAIQIVVVQLLLVLLCILDGFSVDYDKLYLLITIDCLSETCMSLYMLVIMIYAMSICPNGYEAFYLSMIMTAYNLGNELGEVFGGIAFKFLNIDSSFTLLSHSIVLKGAWTLASCLYLVFF